VLSQAVEFTYGPPACPMLVHPAPNWDSV
jgi:hypothetical protein